MSSEVFYYPYTSVQTIEALKAMILYFDRIHIMNPMETTIGTANTVTDALCLLERESIVNYISPSELLSEYDEIITKNMMDDFEDKDFLSLVNTQEHPKTMNIYLAKIPHKLLDSKYKKYLSDMPRLFDGNYHDIYREGPFQYLDPETFQQFKHQLSPEIVKKYSQYRTAELPFAVGESLMINHALCACDRFSLTPVTDVAIHHNFLNSKFRRIEQTNLLKKILKDYGYVKDMTIDLAATNIINEMVPALMDAEINDVLEFRDYNKDELQRFKVELGKIITEISINMWDEDFYNKIIDIVDGKIKPAIQELKDSTESSKEKILRILKKGASISPLPLILSAIPGFDPKIGILASAGVIVLEEYLESIKKSSKRQKNWCTYLIEAQKKFIA